MQSYRAYNYDFKMYMEGVEIPFKSANVVCTPNGVEFVINTFVTKELFDIKPKTAVQIFFREWYGDKKAWRLMGDGFFSAFSSGEDSLGGRSVGLICRDFRMDIRKTPAAMAWLGVNETPGTPQNMYSLHGIMNQGAVKSLVAKKKSGEDKIADQSVETRLYDSSGLADLASAITRITGTAFGKAGGYDYGNVLGPFSFTTNETQEIRDNNKNGNKNANGGLFFDAFIRGIWMEAVGLTRPNSFLNKRIRADKRFFAPRNFAGYNFWKRNNFGLEVGSTVMGNSRFTSLEAAIMNTAGMFSLRVYSCNTPTLISLKKESPGLEYVIDETVRKFLVEKNADEYGAPYMLNETMMLPPLEFTAPPNCNLFFPPMYDSIQWQYDSDSDITRAHFNVIHSLGSTGGADLQGTSFQIPNNLFKTSKTDEKPRRLPLTLEERYKGTNVYHGSVEYNLAAADAAKRLSVMALNNKGIKKLEEAIAESKKYIDEVEDKGTSWENSDPNNPSKMNIDAETEKLQKLIKQKDAAEKAAQEANKKRAYDPVKIAYQRHAAIKYLNLKYQGRVATINMSFNPFVMCGFPGAIISAVEESNTNMTKTIIGMVQQVSHNILITGNQAEASTTVIMNNMRFEDEPTDFDENGLPLYIEKTKQDKATIDPVTLKFTDPTYRVPDAKGPMVVAKEGDKFDLDEQEISDYRYVKDFLSTSYADAINGKEERIYIDSSYEPNRIFRFYDTVFKHAHRHFMLGTYNDGKKNYLFSYNSMHEAFIALRANNPDLLNDYEKCLQYVKRDICSADGFFHGILGLSSKDGDTYINRKSDFIDTSILPSYYGVSSESFDNGVAKGLGMDTAGKFSSIREHKPITAFIKERREAVEKYKGSIKQVVGVSFNG